MSAQEEEGREGGDGPVAGEDVAISLSLFEAYVSSAIHTVVSARGEGLRMLRPSSVIQSCMCGTCGASGPARGERGLRWRGRRTRTYAVYSVHTLAMPHGRWPWVVVGARIKGQGCGMGGWRRR